MHSRLNERDLVLRPPETTRGSPTLLRMGDVPALGPEDEEMA